MRRYGLVRKLINRGIQNAEVIQAFRVIPRHLFVATPFQSQAYDDVPLPIGYDQTISQPYIVALICERLLSNSTARVNVLEIGAGCGYQTALLSQLYDRVVSVERIGPFVNTARERLASLKIENVVLHHADGSEGIQGDETFCAVVLSAAPLAIDSRLLAMLRPEGCLIAPVGPPNNQTLKLIICKNGEVREESQGSVRFVPIVRGTIN